MKVVLIYDPPGVPVVAKGMGFSRNFPDPPIEDNGNSRGVLKMKIWKIPGGYV